MKKPLSAAALFGVLLVATAGISNTYADAIASIRSNQLTTDREHQLVTQQVAAYLDRAHYLQSPLDDQKSTEALRLFIESLDASKTLFLKSDVDSFYEAYATELDDQLKKGDLEAAHHIYAVYQSRIADYFEFANQFLESGTLIDLASDEQINTDREDAAFFETKSELQDYWRKQLTSQLINISIAQKEEKAKEAVFKNNPNLTRGQDLIRNDSRTSVQVLQERLDRQAGRLARMKSDVVLEGVLNAVMAAYDPHSNYFAPVKATEYNIQSNLELEGIGVTIRADRKDPNYTRIESVVEGGPAAKSGQVKAGEWIIGVAQEGDEAMTNVVGWSLQELVALIRGKRGTKVTVYLIQPGAAESSARAVTITRDVIEQEESGVQQRVITVLHGGEQKRVGVLEIPNFYINFRAKRNGQSYRSVSEDTRAAVEELKAQSIDAMVVDLRNNPGGSLDEVAQMLGDFLQEGSLVQIRDSRGSVQVFKDKDGGKQIYDGPLTVLINLASASASEIFAAAIQDYNRGLVVGSTTTGKGSAQAQISNIAYGQMTITQRKFYRVTGGSTQNKGVVPDISFVNIYDDDLGERSYDNALEWDTIRTAPYRPGADLSKYFAALQLKSEARRKNNPEFVYLNELKQLRVREKERDKTESLNMLKREAELKAVEAETLAIENARRTAKSLKPYPNWESYLAAKDAEAEARAAMKSKDRPALPEDEAFVIEAAQITFDLMQLQSKDSM